jgi:tryptophanyl-tRNA synthetase
MKKRILTGDRPTGPLHLGHYVGSLKNRVRLQDDYDCFFIIADFQFLTDHLAETQYIEEYIKEIVLDWLSVGMDPNKSTFFIQSKIPEIAELTMYFSMMVTIPRLRRNPTVKEEFENSGLHAMSYGFLGYPISQAADILVVRSDLVPVGDDNLPHVEQTREIARTFNKMFKPVFPIPKSLVGEVPRLLGLDGRKMAKSAANAIYLKDSVDEVQRKISVAITDPARIRATDAGHPNVCNIYQYHLAFNQKKAPDIEKECRQGLRGCVSCKKAITDEINSFLEPIRESRAYFMGRPALIAEAMNAGIRRTLAISRETLELVRDAIHYNYHSLLGKINHIEN